MTSGYEIVRKLSDGTGRLSQAMRYWLAVGAIAVASCGGSARPTTTTTSPSAPSASSSHSSGALDRAGACAEWKTIIFDITDNDTQSASKLYALEARVADDDLRREIHKMAELFANHAASIPNTGYASQCT